MTNLGLCIISSLLVFVLLFGLVWVKKVVCGCTRVVVTVVVL